MQTKPQDFLLWGHSLAEYLLMFDLSESDLKQKILVCASGYASFAAEMAKMGHQVVASDPAYASDFASLETHMEKGLSNLVAHLKKEPSRYVQGVSPQRVIQDNQAMLKTFLADFPQGKKEGRYVAASLPTLPFTNDQFDLALCAYFIFSSDFDIHFQINSIKELCRVAREVRIYPLLDEMGNAVTHLPHLIMQLQQENYGVEVKQVMYEMQKGSNAMLRVWSQACQV